MRGPRVGDVGTEILLHCRENGQPVPLEGANITIEILRPGGRVAYEGEVVGGSSMRYVGKEEDDLWPVPGVYRIRGIAEWSDGRRLMTSDLRVTVT